MKTLKYLIATITLTASFAFSTESNINAFPTNTSSNYEEPTECTDPFQSALDFSLKVIETYFDSNCDEYNSMFCDSILNFASQEYIAKPSKTELCRGFDNIVSKNSITYKEYLSNYKTEVLMPFEFEERFGVKFNDGYEFSHMDFFYVGTEARNQTETNKSSFNENMFVFMVTKHGNKWMVRGLNK